MTRTSLTVMWEQIELNEQLLAGRERMFNPHYVTAFDELAQNAREQEEE